MFVIYKEMHCLYLLLLFMLEIIKKIFFLLFKPSFCWCGKCNRCVIWGLTTQHYHKKIVAFSLDNQSASACDIYEFQCYYDQYPKLTLLIAYLRKIYYDNEIWTELRYLVFKILISRYQIRTNIFLQQIITWIILP